jgi:hypothetical protein
VIWNHNVLQEMPINVECTTRGDICFDFKHQKIKLCWKLFKTDTIRNCVFVFCKKTVSHNGWRYTTVTIVDFSLSREINMINNLYQWYTSYAVNMSFSRWVSVIAKKYHLSLNDLSINENWRLHLIYPWLCLKGNTMNPNNFLYILKRRIDFPDFVETNDLGKL